MTEAACRCGHTGNGPHPCHAKNYTCRKPATRRIYNLHTVGLAGTQPKLGANDTWACDDCWADFQKAIDHAICGICGRYRKDHSKDEHTFEGARYKP